MANRGSVDRGHVHRGHSEASAPAPPSYDDDDADDADSDDKWEDGEVEHWDEPENARLHADTLQLNDAHVPTDAVHGQG